MCGRILRIKIPEGSLATYAGKCTKAVEMSGSEDEKSLYTSLPLVYYLTKQGIHCIGTVQQKRLPNCRKPDKDLLKAAVPRGTHEERTATVLIFQQLYGKTIGSNAIVKLYRLSPDGESRAIRQETET